MEGVVNVFPVAKLEPPELAANQVTVEPVGNELVEISRLPGPHRKAPKPTPNVGTVLIVAVTAVLAELKQPLLLASA